MIIMLSNEYWWEKSFSWSELDKFKKSKEKSISNLNDIHKSLELLDSMNLESIPFQSSDDDILKYIPPFRWGELDDYEKCIQNNEYDKACEVLIDEIKSFQSKHGVVPSYLMRRTQDVLEILLGFEYNVIQRIGCITNEMGLIFMEHGEYEKAISIFLESIYAWGYHCTFPYYYIAKIYHYQKEFELEYIVLKIVANKFENKECLDGTLGVSVRIFESLYNVEYYLKNGEFIEDCLPSDPKSLKTEIKRAKTILENGNIEEGLKILENIVKKGTYSNTVYFTLYSNYIKLENWDCAIKICEKAIEVLGFYSKDRIKMYTIYKNRAIKKKE